MNVVVRGKAAPLRLEGAAEGPDAGVAALAADLRERQIGIAHEQAGFLDPDRVDKLSEVDMQLVGEKVAQVGDADAQGPGNALEGDVLEGVLRNILNDAAAQGVVAVVIDGAIGEAVEHAGQKNVQIGDAERQIVLHVQPVDAADGLLQVLAGPGRGNHRLLRQQAVKGAGIFRNDIGGKDRDDASDILAQPVIAVRNQREDDQRVPG